LRNNGKIEFQKDELEIVVNEILSGLAGITTSSPSFVKDLVTTVPLFVKEGATLRWSHKSLMEYFASMFICNDAKEKQKPILMKFYESDGFETYVNVFDLCSDIDYSSFRASIIRDVLENFIRFSDLFNRKNFDNEIGEKLLDDRVGFSFDKNIGFAIFYAGENFAEVAGGIWKESASSEALIEDSPKNGSRNEYIFSFNALEGFENNEKGTGAFVHYAEIIGRSWPILNILRRKNPDIFRKISFDNSKLQVKNLTLEIKKFYVINDKKDSIFNKKENFEFANNILSFETSLVLDGNKVRKELSIINQDLSNGIDSLLAGIGV
jgi:hypothetical protein